MAAVAGSRAVAQTDAERRYAVVSLIGDAIELVYANHQTGGLLDRNVRNSLPDTEGTFDKMALLATSEAIQRRVRGARVDLLGFPPSVFHREPERILQGSSVGLPGALIDAMNKAGSTHLVLLTKHRAEANFGFLHSETGVGQLRGLGYYIDTMTRVQDSDTRSVETGFLAPYAYVRLTLADVRDGRVLAQRHVTATRVYPVAGTAVASDPWEVLAPQQKVERLRALLQAELTRELPLLIDTR